VNLRFSDWKWAGIAAFVLLGAAAFIVFAIRPGGFEGGGYWLIFFLPGTLMGIFAGDHIYLNQTFFWTLTFGLSFAWYYAIAYAAIKACRLVARAFGR